MAKEKFITSHKFRVEKAKKQLETWPDKVTIFDREAFVEFYLFEDIIKFYKFKLSEEASKEVSDEKSEKKKNAKIKIYSEIIDVFSGICELAYAYMRNGNYKIVWSSVPEHALMTAANKPKYSKKLLEIAMEIADGLSK